MSSQNSPQPAAPAASLAERLAQTAQQRSASSRRDTGEIFGETVEIRSITVGEKHRLIDEAFVRKGKQIEPVLAKLVPSLLHKALHDPTTGERVFASPEAVAAFIDSVPDEAGDEVQALVDKAMRVSGLDKTAEREAAKNSAASAG